MREGWVEEQDGVIYPGSRFSVSNARSSGKIFALCEACKPTGRPASAAYDA
jgi:hypothetical protein